MRSKLNSAKNQVIDIKVFQSQAMKIQKKVEVAQQNLLAKVETIQNHFQTIDQVLKDISLREREVGATRVAFQEAIIETMKEEMVISYRLSIPEETRGNILLKTWEHNIFKNRKRAKEMRDVFEETFGLINKKNLYLNKESSLERWAKLT